MNDAKKTAWKRVLFILWCVASIGFYGWLIATIVDRPPRSSDYLIVFGIGVIPIAMLLIGVLIARRVGSQGHSAFRPFIAGTITWIAMVVSFSLIDSAADGHDFDDYFFDNMWGPLICGLPPVVSVLATLMFRWAFGRSFFEAVTLANQKEKNLIPVALMLLVTFTSLIAASNSGKAYDAANSAEWQAEEAASSARDAAYNASSAEDAANSAALEAGQAASVCRYR